MALEYRGRQPRRKAGSGRGWDTGPLTSAGTVPSDRSAGANLTVHPASPVTLILSNFLPAAYLGRAKAGDASRLNSRLNWNRPPTEVASPFVFPRAFQKFGVAISLVG
jgi:hypothetical protein